MNLHVSMKLMRIYLSELLHCGIPNHLISGELIILLNLFISLTFICLSLMPFYQSH